MRFNQITVKKATLVIPVLALLLSLVRSQAADPYPYVPGQVIVRLKPAAAAGMLSAMGYRESPDAAGADFEVITTRSGQTVEDAVAELSSRSDVVFAQPNYIYHALNVIPNDTQFAAQYHLSLIGAPEAWEYARGSLSETIAIIDSGADTAHIDLAARLVIAPGINIIGGNSDPSDTPSGSGHGTFVAGVAGAVTNNGIFCAGVDWFSNILPIRVLSGSNAIGTSADIDSGLRRAIALKATVINLSLGFDDAPIDPLIEARLLEAYNAGIITVAAAGNGFGHYVIYPASSTYAIAIGSSTSSDARSSFSSYGAYPGLTGVDVMAPGSGIVSLGLNSTVTSGNGTSFSSPQVAAAAAMVRGVRPGVTPAEFLTFLRSTAKDIDQPGYDEFTGAGRMDLARLLRVAAANTFYGDSLANSDTRTASMSAGGRQSLPKLILNAQDSYAGYFQKFAASKGAIQFYWRPDSAQSSTTETLFVLTQKGNTAHLSGNLDLIYRQDRKLEYRLQDSGAIISTATLIPGQWYHIAVAYGDSGMVLYINGETQGALPASRGGPPLSDTVYLGAPFALGGARSAWGRFSALGFSPTQPILFPSALQISLETQKTAATEVATVNVGWKTFETETNTLTVSVYADTDASDFNGTLLASGLTNDQSESVSILSLTQGTPYYLYVVATDQTTAGLASPEQAFSYAAATITPSAPAVVEVTGTTGSPGSGGCVLARLPLPESLRALLRAGRDLLMECLAGRMLTAAWYALAA